MSTREKVHCKTRGPYKQYLVLIVIHTLLMKLLLPESIKRPSASGHAKQLRHYQQPAGNAEQGGDAEALPDWKRAMLAWSGE
jgi:hypothetical protein